MKKDLQLQTVALRKEGYSVKELHSKIGVSKSTISRWIQNVPLSNTAQARLKLRYTNGQLESQKTIHEITVRKNQVAVDFAEKVLLNASIDKTSKIILCAMIYHCEGNKSVKSVTFTNSDPFLIATFLNLLRSSFDIKEDKFHILMHLHRYHNEEIQKEFWSALTRIPKNQFYRSYAKESNEKYKKEGYQGCVSISYGDVSIARKLRSIAKTFMERYN